MRAITGILGILVQKVKLLFRRTLEDIAIANCKLSSSVLITFRSEVWGKVTVLLIISDLGLVDLLHNIFGGGYEA
jgi:hypothetical protein